MDSFTRAYIECALWSSSPLWVCFCEHESTDHTDIGKDDTEERGACSECDCKEYSEDDASYESLGYGIEDLAPETLAAMEADCAAFQEENAEPLSAVYSNWEHPEDEGWSYNPEQAGHDYWLTRNGHGAGFWDRYYGVNQELRAAFQALTDSAHHTFHLYIGDDGKVYGS